MPDCGSAIKVANATRYHEGNEAKGVLHNREGCKRIYRPVSMVGSNIRCIWVISLPFRRRKPDKNFDLVSFMIEEVSIEEGMCLFDMCCYAEMLCILISLWVLAWLPNLLAWVFVVFIGLLKQSVCFAFGWRGNSFAWICFCLLLNDWFIWFAAACF